MKSWWRLREQGALCGLCQIVGLYEERMEDDSDAANMFSHELLNLWEACLSAKTEYSQGGQRALLAVQYSPNLSNLPAMTFSL